MPILQKRIRVVVAKVGCDIHERGALAVAQVLREAGMEVIYTGRYQTPLGVVKTAVEEDADIIALSDSTGSMRIIAESVLDILKKQGAEDVKVVAGGLIPQKDIPVLERMGVTGNFGPGTSLETIVNHISGLVLKPEG